MQIKRLSTNDAPLLVEMVKTFRADTSNLQASQRFLENPDNYLITSIDGEKIVGFVLGYRLQRYDGQADMVYVHEVGVLKEYRRQGLARNMIELLKSLCNKDSLSKIFLITNKSNAPALALYHSTGGRPTHDDDIVYWYELN